MTLFEIPSLWGSEGRLRKGGGLESWEGVSAGGEGPELSLDFTHFFHLPWPGGVSATLHVSVWISLKGIPILQAWVAT